ncbi:hypothetical protein Goe21_01520 [Bacillus phage vB_BsuM-Goe21]|nr:hypothetical protein DA469_22350 [Bacillus subtilis]WCS68262.1 hypothetical protein Goe21_01520 [Bacillus phage vB_BsuM-Goe21]
MKKVYNLKDLAGQFFFGNIKNKEDLEQAIEGKYLFRKNKGISDVNNAIRKSIKNGRGKTELELDWLALYLNDVFKLDRRKNKEV